MEKNHIGLVEIPAPDGSQEFVGHTHECSLFIGQYMPWCRMGPLACAEWVPHDKYYVLYSYMYEQCRLANWSLQV